MARGSREPQGTWLNDVRVRAPTTVSIGDVIRVGRTHFKLNDGDGASEEEREEANEKEEE